MVWWIRILSHTSVDLFTLVSTRQKAIRTAIAVVAGGYQTALVSYFVHRDLFPALMTVRRQYLQPSNCILIPCPSTYIPWIIPFERQNPSSLLVYSPTTTSSRRTTSIVRDWLTT